LIPVDEAVARVITGVAPLAAEMVPVAEAAGRTLAEPLKAQRTQPPFDASAMDGYALRAEDTANTPTTLEVIGMSAAGHRFHGTVDAGQAVRIFTGAPLPIGADAVLLQEATKTEEDGTVTALQPVAAGRHVRRAGLDFREGALLLDAGRRLGLREISLATAMGFAEVPVRRKPRVALIATGDELVAAGQLPKPDQIFAATSPGLAAFVAALGGEAHDLGIARDDRGAIAGVIGDAITTWCRTRSRIAGWRSISGASPCDPANRSCSAASRRPACSACPAIRFRASSARSSSWRR
jgi:molybdopterin molybdotransferase